MANDLECAARIRESEKRISSYLGFLLGAYGTDLNGLAVIAGIPGGELAEFASDSYEQKNVLVLVELARLTGVSLSFLFAEK